MREICRKNFEWHGEQIDSQIATLVGLFFLVSLEIQPSLMPGNYSS